MSGALIRRGEIRMAQLPAHGANRGSSKVGGARGRGKGADRDSECGRPFVAVADEVHTTAVGRLRLYLYEYARDVWRRRPIQCPR